MQNRIPELGARTRIRKITEPKDQNDNSDHYTCDKAERLTKAAAMTRVETLNKAKDGYKRESQRKFGRGTNTKGIYYNRIRGFQRKRI